MIHQMSEEGRTVFLCTHNLMEAQSLCDRVAVLEKGRLIALGTPADLARKMVPGQRLRLEVALESRDAAVGTLRSRFGADRISQESGGLILQGADREIIPELIAGLVAAGVRIYEVTLQEPSLEDVYFALHGRREVAA
jgi:ABC-2 type transport system ATP-binding protein